MLFLTTLWACGTPNDLDRAEARIAQTDLHAEPQDRRRRRRPLSVQVATDVVAGASPLTVDFDAVPTGLPAGAHSYAWSFGDGAVGAGASAVHTYVGAGSFDATVTLTDLLGRRSSATVTIEVTGPAARVCPSPAAPVVWSHVDDAGLGEISGVVASRRAADVYWVHEDSGNAAVLVALDEWGATLSEHAVPVAMSDWEDLAAAIDPATGASTLFLADTGDNARARGSVSVWVAPEPDPFVDAALPAPLELELEYPDGPRDSEALLVDPVTTDLYVVTKSSNATRLYVKRAPHDTAGTFVLEALGAQAELPLVVTGGDVSPDGSMVVVRDYTATARLYLREAGESLEDALARPACAIPLHAEPQGEAIAFAADGSSLVTISEGVGQALHVVTW